jgi:hypothetical protein
MRSPRSSSCSSLGLSGICEGRDARRMSSIADFGSNGRSRREVAALCRTLHATHNRTASTCQAASCTNTGKQGGTLSGLSRALCCTGAHIAFVRDECATVPSSDILTRNWKLHHRKHVNALGHTGWRRRLTPLLDGDLRRRASVARPCRVCTDARTCGHCRGELQDIDLSQPRGGRELLKMNKDEPWERSFKVRLLRFTSSEPTELTRLPFFDSSRGNAASKTS